jgi:SOS-response transcriptional repressor LexA
LRLDELLQDHHSATFLAMIGSSLMVREGIFDEDFMVVDRSSKI